MNGRGYATKWETIHEGPPVGKRILRFTEELDSLHLLGPGFTVLSTTLPQSKLYRNFHFGRNQKLGPLTQLP